jgi:alpha-D-ribose 1-methylphosphonate 5-triphosphate synthase subunit PhnH
MVALALALCDNNTPLWLDAGADAPQTRHHLRFHCGASFTENPPEAAFAFIARPERMPRLSTFHLGRADFPDRSTTVVIRVDRSAEATGPGVMEVTGPGVKGNDHGMWEPFLLGGLPSWLWTDWADNHASYPLDVDVLFVDTGISDSGKPFAAVLGLPRTARVRER